MKTIVIGVTGAIGSGKTSAVKHLEELGGKYFGADEISHEIMLKDTEVWKRIVDKFGSKVLNEAGEIDRKKLANIVFFDSEKRKVLEEIMHPKVGEVIKNGLKRLEQQKHPPDVVVIEIPLLVEADMFELVDKVLVITASDYHRLVRTITKGMPAREALARLRSQIGDQERLKHADYAISNDGSIAQLWSQLELLWSELTSCALERKTD